MTLSLSCACACHRQITIVNYSRFDNDSAVKVFAYGFSSAVDNDLNVGEAVNLTE